MHQKLSTFAIYVAIICFLLGIIALTQAVISNSSQGSHTEYIENNI